MSASAQTPLRDPVRDVVRDCRPSTDGSITVCARRGEQAREPYRLPLRQDGFDPEGRIDSVSRERHRLYDVGNSGSGSCSPAGAGGWTGCLLQQWRSRDEQHGYR